MNAQDFLNGRLIFSQDVGIYDKYKHKQILITGACGSMGKALYTKLVDQGLKVTGLDWDEYQVSQNPEIILADFAEINASSYDYVFHCAAYKHVKVSEKRENHEAVFHNNALKVNVFLHRLEEKRTRVVLVSTDKVTGTSFMGKTKKEAEDLCVENGQTAIRLVNVAWSRGSVLDIWSKSHTLRVCPGYVTRYWMQQEDAIYALLTVGLMRSGLYVVNECPQISMKDMRDAYKKQFGGTFIEIPLEKGEAIHEKLLCDDETQEGDHPYIKRIEKRSA